MDRMTKRPTNDYMETWMYREIPALDHGHVVVTDYLGDEASIVESAKISYGTGTRSVSNDVGLLRYLMRHKHTTPFESCELKVKMKLPIFVARQLIRHRTASVNEYSARYSELLDEFYIPDIRNLQPQSTTNKQGRAGTLTNEQKRMIRDLLIDDSKLAYQHYKVLLGDKQQPWRSPSTGLSDPYPEKQLMDDAEFPGIARELARLGMTLNTYTQWIWKIDLHNLLHFIGLRSDAHAQYEIRVYSDILRNIVHGWMPNVYDAFMDYHPNMNGVLLSAQEWAVIKQVLNNIQFPPGMFADMMLQYDGISKRERDALLAKINAP
jgi:thymidylate synthase (FAD)